MTDTDVRIIKQKLDDHIANDSSKFAALGESLKALDKKVTVLKDNHISHLSADVSVLKTDMSWVKKVQWLMLTTAITNLIGIIYIILQK